MAPLAPEPPGREPLPVLSPTRASFCAQASTGKRGLKGVLESRNQKDKIRMEQLLELVRTLATSWASMH